MTMLADWLKESGKDRVSPFGGRIPVGPYGELLSVGLDDPAPDLTAEIALGCLPVLTAEAGHVPTWATPEGQPRLGNRAAHLRWLAGAGRGFPAVVTVAAGQTLRQACNAAGVDPDAPLVGIPAAAF